MNTNFSNMGTPESGQSGLGHIIETLKEKGLPSTDEMRAVVEQRRQEDFRLELKNDIESSLAEYTILFGKFRDGSATDQEMTKMGEVLNHLEDLQRQLGIKN